MVPAHQGLAADDLAGVEIVFRLEIEDEFAVAQAVEDLRHQNLLIAARDCRARPADLTGGGGEALVLGQALQKLGDLLHLLLLAVAHLVFHRGDDVLVEFLRKQAEITPQHVPGDAVYDIEKQGEDHARDGRIERHLDTGQQRLHAGQRDIHGTEADAADTDDKADEGAQDAETGQRAGDLHDHVLPAPQAQDVLVYVVLDVGQGLAGLPLSLHLLLIVAEQTVQRALVEEVLDLNHDRPVELVWTSRARSMFSSPVSKAR